MIFGNWFGDHGVRQYMAAWCWNLGGMNLGIFLGWSAVAKPMLQSKTSPVFGTSLSDEEISYTNSLPYIASLCSAIVWGYIASTLGRKITGYLTALCYVTCFGLILKTTSVHVLLTSRMIGGLAYCAVLFNGPMYIAEMAETQKLGRLSSTYLISENFGTLMIYAMGGYVSFTFLNIFSMVFALLFLVSIMMFPESPVFYLRNGRDTEARLALQFFRPQSNQEYLDSEMKRLNETFLLSKKMKFRFLFTRHTLMAMFIAMYIQVGVQCTGINYITMYTVDIFQRSASFMDPYLCTTIAGVLHTIAPCFYFIITNSFGRKTISVVSYVLQSLILGCLGWYFFYIDRNNVDPNSFLNYLPVLCMSLFFLTYSAGAGCVPFTLYSEIFSSEVRNTVMPFIYIWNALATFVILKLVPTFLLHTIHMYGVLWVLSGCCLVTVFFTLVFIPETKDKPFLKIIEDLTKKAFW